MPNAYIRRHLKVYAVRGKAREYACECGEQARDWAQVHDTDGLNPYADYKPMCRRCHFRYDRVAERSAEKRRGRPQTSEAIKNRAQAIRNIKRADNRSGVPGVHRHNGTGKWAVQIRHVHGGLFEKLEDAVKARNELAVRTYGPDVRVYSVPAEQNNESN